MEDPTGAPSSPHSDLIRSLRLIHEERHLAAHALYRRARDALEEAQGPETSPGQRERLRQRLHRRGGRARTGGQDEHERARALLSEKMGEFEGLEARAGIFEEARKNFSAPSSSGGAGWIFAHSHRGITTHYRRDPEAEGGSLTVRIEGSLEDIPIFEQIAVLREIDLYDTWSPFCSGSRRLAQLGRLDVVGWLVAGLPKFGLVRDACFRCVGCDSLTEDGTFLLVAEGLGDRSGPREGGRTGGDGPPPPPADEEYGSYLGRDSLLSGIELPPVPRGVGAGRITIRSFQGQVDVLSPTSARTRLVANIDPNLRFVPQPLIDFAMKRMAGVLLQRLQEAAARAAEDPAANPHARRIREDATFYRQWLLPKFREYAGVRGWDLPPVAALGVGEDELGKEEWDLYRQTQPQTPEGATPSEGGKVDPSDGMPTASGGGDSRRGKLFSPRKRLFSPGATESDMSLSAFTSPRQRWKEKEARKKAQQVQEARQAAADRLRPARPTEEQAERLRQLYQAKRRFQELPVHRQGRSAGRKGGVRACLRAPLLIEVFSCTHPYLPFRLCLPVMALVLLVVYHGDQGLLYRAMEAVVGGDPSQSPPAESVRMALAHHAPRAALMNAAFWSVLALYDVIHWAVLNLLLMVAFDFVELPLMVYGGTKMRRMRSSKALYAGIVRRATGAFTVALTVFAVGGVLLRASYDYAVVNVIPEEWPSLGDAVSIASEVALVNATEWVDGNNVGLALCNTIFKINAASISWRRDALDASKILMSYSAAFTMSFLLIALVLFPKINQKRYSPSKKARPTDHAVSGIGSEADDSPSRNNISSTCSVSVLSS